MEDRGNWGLSFERQRSLAEQIADAIVEAISLGIFKPGERIVETEIATRFKVSRVPVREALKILETQGILQGEPHRGLRVIPIDDTLIDQIREARLAIELIAVRAVKENAAVLPELSAALSRRIDAIRSQARAGELGGVNVADTGFHADICRLSGNRIIWTLWESIARHVAIVFGREILSEASLANIADQHEDLRRAIIDGTLDDAMSELELHILRLRRVQRTHSYANLPRI